MTGRVRPASCAAPRLFTLLPYTDAPGQQPCRGRCARSIFPDPVRRVQHGRHARAGHPADVFHAGSAGGWTSQGGCGRSCGQGPRRQSLSRPRAQPLRRRIQRSYIGSSLLPIMAKTHARATATGLDNLEEDAGYQTRVKLYKYYENPGRCEAEDEIDLDRLILSSHS